MFSIFILLLQSSMQSWSLCHHQRKWAFPITLLPSLLSTQHLSQGPFLGSQSKERLMLLIQCFLPDVWVLVSNFRLWFLVSGEREVQLYPSISQQCFLLLSLVITLKSLLHLIIPFTLFWCCGEFYLFLFVCIFVCSIQQVSGKRISVIQFLLMILT